MMNRDLKPPTLGWCPCQGEFKQEILKSGDCITGQGKDVHNMRPALKKSTSHTPPGGIHSNN